MARASCNLCPWQSQDYQSRDAAGYESTWHVYEQHCEVWLGLFGRNQPRDPDPRVQVYNADRRIHGRTNA